MENFVFPNENKTKLMEMYELMSIFPILTGILQKAAKGHFLFALKKTVIKAFMFWTATQREMHKSKKAQHVDLLTSAY